MAPRGKLRKKTKAKVLRKGGTSDDIEQYVHKDKKRPYNPPVGLVTPETDIDMPRRKYSFDPRLDPQLLWSGKKENPSFEVDTVSLHVHERIDPLTIIEKIIKKEEFVQQSLFHYFETPENNPPLREAIQFYKHSQNWSNRLIAGDSLLVMNSLLQKEGMAGKVQMIYIDPPYGIKYGSNFQPFVNKRDVKDGKDEDLTAEPEMIKAFRDTWELGIHSYLTYLRDRLLLARELLHESGSVFVQISDENVHHVRELMDEVFGAGNFVNLVSFLTTSGFEAKTLSRSGDYLVWYSKDITKVKFRRLFEPRSLAIGEGGYSWVQLQDGTRRGLTKEERENPKLIPKGSRVYKVGNIKSQGKTNSPQEFEFGGKKYHPGPNHHWKTTVEGLRALAKANRIHTAANSIQYIRYLDDFPFKQFTNMWLDTGTGSFLEEKLFVVQTSTKVIERCMLMTTDPGDLVFDPTCGSGTTADVAEQWGRRWITCDTSRVAITLAKQRLMTATYDYYELAHPEEGVRSGFKYKTVPHVMLRSIANNEPPTQEVLHDQPYVDKSKIRVSGPLTVEAVPSPVVKSLETLGNGSSEFDISISRTRETARQEEWRDEILHTGVRGIGQRIEFVRVEPLQGTTWLHADAETKEEDPKRVVLSFGPAFVPLEQRQVAMAIEEAQKLVPKPRMIIFAAFQFDPEAAKDIDELEWPGVATLKVQMNTDLLTADLKRKTSSNESFWLMGQPDIALRSHDGKHVLEVVGFDYYNTRTGAIESGDTSKIAMWMLDTDYDGRSLYPQQVFFPLAGDSQGWSRLSKTLKAEIDEELLEKYRGTISLPFSAGKHKRIAVKIIDDRGIESLKIVDVK